MSKLLEEVRDLIRTLHYTYRTEEACLHWIRQYILFHGKRHPTEMGVAEVSAFLTHLAVKRQVAASTQNQALAALLFLYKNVPKEDYPGSRTWNGPSGRRAFHSCLREQK